MQYMTKKKYNDIKKNTSKSSTGLKKEKIGGKIDKKQVLAGSLY